MGSKPPPRPKRAGPGRPPEYSRELPVYDTMQQCSGSTGIPLTALRKYKGEGCPAFTNGRVRLAELLKWIYRDPNELDATEASEDWGKRFKRAEALIKEAKLQEQYERVVEFETVAKFIDWLVALFFAEFDRFEQEYPASLKAKSELEIQAEVVAQNKLIKENVTATVKAWIASKGKTK